MNIDDVFAIQLLDSRGVPTIETTIKSGNFTGRATVPSGASTGKKEASELRDGNADYCHGKSVLKAVKNVNKDIKDLLINTSFSDQKSVDQKLISLDNTEDKSKLGANTILSVSLAIADLASKALNISLYEYIGGKRDKIITPCPMINVINGGKHANNLLDIQEFMIMPTYFDSINDALFASATVFMTLRKLLDNKGLSTSVGDEGGFAPEIQSANVAIELLIESIEKSGFEVGKDFVIALDCAASELYNAQSKIYELKGEGVKLNSEDLLEKYLKLVEKYPILSIEDGFAENDLDGFAVFNKELGKKIQIVGDDLFCTNPTILKEYIPKNLANALLVKVNQIGTLSEALEAVNIAHNAGYNSIISHRSGETEDVKIVHIAIATNAGQIKCGSVCRSDRTAKYNELLRIENECKKTEYNGKEILKQFKFI